jgi:scyllo-inositol 2-dehydrogenase (NADP+)
MQPIKTAICSFGMSGKLFHAPFIDVNPHFELYAVFERSKNLAQEIYPNIKTFRSLDEMLTDPSIELVVVNTPNATHYEYTKAALNAGKHVIVEKPFTVHVHEAEELTALANRKNVKLSVYHNRRYDSGFRTIKKLLDENVLGKIVEAEFHFDRFKEELSPKVHKETPGPGTGALNDLGSHLIDQALQLFGMPNAVFGDIQIMRPISKVDDYFEVLLFYPHQRVRLKGTYVAREPIPGYVIHGSKGSFLKTAADVQEAALLKGIKPNADNWGVESESEQGLLHAEINGEVIRKRIPTIQGNYMLYYDGVYESIRNNKPLPVTGEDGIKVMKIIEAAFKSNKEKSIINIS